MKSDLIQKHFKMYLEAFDNLKDTFAPGGLVGKTNISKDLFSFLTRLGNGLGAIFESMGNHFENLQFQMQSYYEQSKQQLEDIHSEYKKFREANDLDHYFSKFLSEDTRKNTLHLVEELVKIDEN